MNINKDNIMVTIMITYYNQKRFIEDSLGGVIKQETTFPYEIICGDDGSTDGTYEELLYWRERYPNIISVYQMDREEGIEYEPIIRASNNRYNMLKHARGKYITILDGDDYYTSTKKLQKQVEILEKYPDVSGCCHTITMTWDDETLAEKTIGRLCDYPIRLRNDIYWESMWQPAEAFVFRNYYRGNEDIIDSNFFDDNMITSYFIKYGDIVYIPDSMLTYRQHKESSWNMRNELQKIYINIYLYQESKRILSNMKLACYSRCSSILRLLYKYRNEDFGEQTDFFLITDKMYNDTLKFKNSNVLFKIKYLVRYFIPAFGGKILTIKKVLNRLTWKRVEL